MCLYISCIWIYLILAYNAEAARILGVFPVPSRSHQIVFRAYIQELAKRGHEIVVITPNPVLKEKQPYNVTEIDISGGYNTIRKLFMQSNYELKRGLIIDVDVVLKYNTYKWFLHPVIEQMQQTSVSNLLNDKTQKFDLIVAEGFYEYHLIVSKIFKAPMILFASHMGFPHQYETIGASSIHPIFYPDFNRRNHGYMGFWPMLVELYYEWKLFNCFKYLEYYQNEILKENYGPNAPTTKQLLQNVDMMFLSSYNFFAHNRAVPPNVIYLGAIHLKPPKEIPEDLKLYLDNSKPGVVYVSFGSNIRPSLMENDFRNALFEAFEALPYDILFKYDGDSLENVPNNVKWQQWFPQRDLLFHPNIKAFITQGGLQSTDEAIDAEIPLVGVPMMAEQWYNTHKYVDLGIGVKLDSLTMTADDLVEGVKTVIGNNSYKENMKRIKKIRTDEVQSAWERAVWWTEYTIRHRGAKHLRTPTADVTWNEYYMVNIFLPIAAVLVLLIIILYYLLKKIFSVLLKVVKLKQN